MLGFALSVISGLISVKLKHDNCQKWWLPIVICGSLFVLFIAFLIWVMIDFMNTRLCVWSDVTYNVLIKRFAPLSGHLSPSVAPHTWGWKCRWRFRMCGYLRNNLRSALIFMPWWDICHIECRLFVITLRMATLYKILIPCVGFALSTNLWAQSLLSLCYRKGGKQWNQSGT